MAGATGSNDRPDELNITFSPVDEGGAISLYHVGLSLVAIQRIVNRLVEIEGRMRPELYSLSPEQRRSVFLLSFEEVHASDLKIKATILQGLLQALGPIVSGLANSVVVSVLSTIVLTALNIQEWPNRMIEVDPSLLPPFEELATALVAGKIVLKMDHGDLSCRVDKATLNKLKDLKNHRLAGSDQTVNGIVVGSSMNDKRMDIYFDVFGKAIPCYYDEHQAETFRKYTRDGTPVSVTGEFVWPDGGRTFGPPIQVWLRSIERNQHARGPK